jgi:hypothetical protein
LVKGACAGNRRGKVQYLGNAGVDNWSTNLIVAAVAHREARIGKDIVHNVQVALESYVGGISYLNDADDPCARVKLTSSSN